MRYITEYKPEWLGRFWRIASQLREFLPSDCRVHHVGSTSVPGMPAKDIIDLDIECSHGSMPIVIRALAQAGYEHEGDKGIRGREAFRPYPGSEAGTFPSHHLYACETGADELKKHLAFRNYLVDNPDRAKWLAAQKIAVDAAAESRDAYIEKKGDFYTAITTEALDWAKQAVHDHKRKGEGEEFGT
jgi:GrpB-like predicted nucleotidyltransferase (UPF0157 family)